MKDATATTAAVAPDREWDYAYDDDHAFSEGEDAVMLLIRDSATGEILEAVGGITLTSLQISDHGNVNLSPDDEAHLATMAQELIAA